MDNCSVNEKILTNNDLKFQLKNNKSDINKRISTNDSLMKRNIRSNKSEIVLKNKIPNIITNFSSTKYGPTEIKENNSTSILTENRSFIDAILFPDKKYDGRKRETLQSNRFVDEYEESIKSGPRYVCVCCGLLEFQDSVEIFFENATTIHNELKSKAVFLKKKFFDNNYYWICKVCSKQLNENKLPKIALVNSLEFPVINEQIRNLSELEERLCSPRVAFLKIRQLNYENENGNELKFMLIIL